MQPDRNHRLAFMNSKKTTTKGFTLVEMAIVLVIIGLILGMGVGMIGPLTTMSKVRESREVVEADIASVVSWAASNTRLPNGYAEFQTVISRPNDAWGSAAYYFYEPLLTAGNICGRKTTNLTICKTTTCAAGDRIINIAAVVISGGSNYNPQTGIITCPTGVSGICLGMFDVDTVNIDNCSDTTNCPDSSIPVPTFQRLNRPESYDDIVRWVTLDELRSKIGCQGAQLKIVNNELPFTNYSSLYGPINIVADGGTQTGNYQWKVKLPPPPATKPSGIKFNNQSLAFTNTSTSGWFSGTGNSPLVMQGYARPQGSYNYTIYVMDNDSNSTQKSFVLTVNP